MLIAIGSDDAFHLGMLSSRVHEASALAQGGTLEDKPRYNKSRCFETFPFPANDTGLTPELRQRIAALAEQIEGSCTTSSTPPCCKPPLTPCSPTWSPSMPAAPQKKKPATSAGCAPTIKTRRFASRYQIKSKL